MTEKTLGYHLTLVQPKMQPSVQQMIVTGLKKVGRLCHPFPGNPGTRALLEHTAAFASLRPLRRRQGQMLLFTPKPSSLFAIVVQVVQVEHANQKSSLPTGTRFQNLLQPASGESVKVSYLHCAANCLAAPLRSGRRFRHCTSKHRTWLCLGPVGKSALSSSVRSFQPLSPNTN